MSRRSSSDDGGVLADVVEHTSPMLQLLDPGQIQAHCVEGKMQVTENASLAYKYTESQSTINIYREKR